ncbi:hypothetical protein E6O75_ATG01456 [Venturia nashicola]|uniref:Uncharacterized protein n=1 Tax=Venturia nashicola TaxID=86259 RepID=A0A4Z1PEV6_9PEZI|nr:hypothetical protein E6O75_ATG01456 [Venturia nashicola]
MGARKHQFSGSTNHRTITAMIYEGDQEIKYLHGALSCPSSEDWDGTFRTPNSIDGNPICMIRNYVTGQTDTGHHCRHPDCGVVTARCYNQLGHMSWCKYWVQHEENPCGARVRNEKGYCEYHSRIRPRDYETWDEKMARIMAERNPPKNENEVPTDLQANPEPAIVAPQEVANDNGDRPDSGPGGLVMDTDVDNDSEEDHQRFQQAEPFKEKRKKAARIATKDCREQEKKARIDAECEAIHKKHKDSFLGRSLIAAKKGVSKLRR